jgi:hypothetical protein
MDFPIKTIDDILSKLGVADSCPKRTLFWGDGAGEISSYVAGWMAAKKIDVVLLDGANRFNPYTVSSFARRTWISPEDLLKRIRIARAFTCYQMATLMSEKLFALFKEAAERPWVIILGPMTTFLDEDVPEREARPLFERSLRRIEEMMKEGAPFFFFQNIVSHSPFRPFMKGLGRVMEPRREYLTRRLFHFSDLVWRIGLDGEEPKLVLEKGWSEKHPNHKPQIPNKFQSSKF